MDIALVGGQSPQQQQQRAELAATSVKPMAPKETELKRQDLTQPVDASQKADAKDREEERLSKQEQQEELNAVAQEMSNMMSVMRKGLDFRVDDKSGEAVVSVMDVESGDIIRQIPSEEALKLAQKMSEVTGLLMKTEA